MKTTLVTLIAMIFAIGLAATDAEARSLRSWAKAEAKLVHRRGAGHYQKMHPKARFVGTGSGSQTCRTNGRAKLTVRHKGSTVRVW